MEGRRGNGWVSVGEWAFLIDGRGKRGMGKNHSP